MGKLLLYPLIFLMMGMLASAQQKPLTSQYMLNNFLLNPAVSGIENYTDLRAGYRDQWTGLKGAPVSSYVTISMPLGHAFKAGDAAAFPASGTEDPAGRLLTGSYQAAEAHHGIGLTLLSDKAGPVSATNLDLSYAYHIGLAARLNLAMGFSAGFRNVLLNRAEITLANANDPALREEIANTWQPDLGAGLWLYSKDFYAGISARQLISAHAFYAGTPAIGQWKSSPGYYLTAGLKLFLSEDLSILPSLLLKKSGFEPLSFDLNLKFSYLDSLWAGISYRHNDSYSALLGININSLLNLGYSYDLTLSTLNKVSSGSHEIVLGFLLNNRYRVHCPQRSF